MGMMTAWLLSKHNYDITIYFKDSVIKQNDFTSHKYTSQITGGLFMPHFEDYEFLQFGIQAVEDTYYFFKRCCEENTIKGVLLKDYFFIEP